MITHFSRIVLVSSLLLSVVTGNALQADDLAKSDDAAGDCCRAGTDIKQHLKNADRLYPQFKPREAGAELQKVLETDPNNIEAVLKLCRAQIDMGDTIPEGSQNWKEKRLKEYTAAEEYARKAVALSPNSTWSHFYLAASLGNIAVLSPRDRQIELANDVRSAVEKSIALDPTNGFAYHVYG